MFKNMKNFGFDVTRWCGPSLRFTQLQVLRDCDDGESLEICVNFTIRTCLQWAAPEGKNDLPLDLLRPAGLSIKLLSTSNFCEVLEFSYHIDEIAI